MNTTQQRIIVALIKAQEAVISWGEKERPKILAIADLEELDSRLKEATKLAKQLRKE